MTDLKEKEINDSAVFDITDLTTNVRNKINGIMNGNKDIKQYDTPAGRCVKTVRNAFETDLTKSIKFRRQQLKNLKKMYEDMEAEMLAALKEDLRKSPMEAFMTEIDFVKNDVINMLMNLDKWTKPKSVGKDIANFFNTLKIFKDPYGVVLIMGTWNYPIQSTLLPLAGAIAGGNCVVIKPSESSPATSAFIAKAIPKYLDRNCYCVFEGGILETTQLLSYKFDYIFFTGSADVGKIVHQAAAKSLTPATIKLRGKSPVYVDDEVDVETATRRLLWGKCINLGQTCIAPDYVLCSKRTEERIIEAAKKVLVEFFGNDIKGSQDLCRVTRNNNGKKFEKLVELLKQGTIAIGGSYDLTERFIEPTILTNVNPNDPIMTEEIFGPILPIYNVSSPQDAARFINAREKPLAFYIFSKNKANIEFLLKNTSSGGVCVNDTMMHICSQNLPFGGVGGSGFGAYQGKKSFDTFVHEKSVLLKGYGWLPEKLQSMKYYPYTERNRKLLSFLTKKRFDLPLWLVSYFVVFVVGMIVMLVILIPTKM